MITGNFLTHPVSKSDCFLLHPELLLPVLCNRVRHNYRLPIPHLQEKDHAVPLKKHGAQNSFKQEEYMAVVGIALYTRAVIDGGVPAEDAYSISDKFIKKISGINDIRGLKRINRIALEEFILLVQKNKEKNVTSIHIENAKNYICRHLQSRLTIQEVAAAVNISSSHLSALFQNHENISVKQYILDKKLEAAANMLRYSNYEIMTISNYLHFSSPSHLGAAFRKQYHCTPSEYRRKYFSA